MKRDLLRCNAAAARCVHNATIHGATSRSAIGVPRPTQADVPAVEQGGDLDRGERLAVTSAIVDRGIESSSLLSKTEAGIVIDTLADETFDESAVLAGLF